MYVKSHSASGQHKGQFEIALARLLAALARVPVTRWQFVIQLILLVVLCLSLSKLFWLLVPSPKLPEAVIVLSTVTSNQPTADSSIHIEQLKSFNLFGQEAAKATTASAEAQAVDSHLNLVLVGVMTSNNEAASHAIISMGDKADVFIVGSSLPVGSNVTLTKVLSDRAIISNNGQAETLWLYGNDSHITQSYAAPARTPVEDYTANNETTRDPALAQAARSLADVISGSVERDRNTGQMSGYRIRPGRDAAKFQQLGLQADDLVTAINGTPLTNPATLMEIYKGMGNSTSANLEIKRGGTLLTIPVRL